MVKVRARTQHPCRSYTPDALPPELLHLQGTNDHIHSLELLYVPFDRSDRIRTCGILLPKQARCQLRYTPANYKLLERILNFSAAK